MEQPTQVDCRYIIEPLQNGGFSARVNAKRNWCLLGVLCVVLPGLMYGMSIPVSMFDIAEDGFPVFLIMPLLVVSTFMSIILWLLLWSFGGYEQFTCTSASFTYMWGIHRTCIGRTRMFDTTQMQSLGIMYMGGKRRVPFLGFSYGATTVRI